MKKRFELPVILSLLVLILSACAGMNPDMAALEKDSEAKAFSPTPGQSKLYIVRASKFGGAGMYITPTVDRMVTGVLSSGSYLMVEMTPGEHQVSAAGNLAEPDVVELTTEAGQLYFVEMHPTFGLNRPGLAAERLDEQDGREMVSEYNRFKACEVITPTEKPTPAAEAATLYLIRPSQLSGALMNLAPTVDDRVPAILESGSYVVTKICQGNHLISAAGKFEGEFTHQLQTEAGQTYYVTIKHKMGWALPQVAIETIDQEEGENLVSKYKQLTEL